MLNSPIRHKRDGKCPIREGINEFLEKYWLKAKRNMVDDSLLNFFFTLHQIKLSQFTHYLLPSIKKIGNTNKENESSNKSGIFHKDLKNDQN